MRCLIVHAHPNPESFNAALCRQAASTLTDSGHHVDVLDLYQLDFDPCMSEHEHLNYDRLVDDGLLEPMVAEHVDLVTSADALIFVYPTWWAGLPAVLKGWLERVLLPGAAFELAPAGGGSGPVRVEPRLTNIRQLIGITTYGSSRLDTLVLGDAGRRTIRRTVRLVCNRRCKTAWLSLHRLDTSSPEQRAELLDRVTRRLQAL